MKQMVRLIAPAKVNLVLAVGSVRDDGFHSVHTIMHTLALHDSLTMRRFEEDDEDCGLRIRLRCEIPGDIDPLDVSPENNIAYRAVQELASELGRNENETIDMVLSKVIPAEAGLGGGSSNAAAALLGAALLWGVDLNDPKIHDVAARLGADVAFFLHGGCVRLSGKGEVFESALTPRKGFALLVRPQVGVSTSKAYAAFDANPQLPDEAFIEQFSRQTDASQVALWNNLEQAACTVTPELTEVLQWAADSADSESVVLCGSGSAVCVLCDSYTEAQKHSLEAFRRGWWSRITAFSPVGASAVEAY